MSIQHLQSELAAAASLADLARRLGFVCLNRGAEIATLLAEQAVVEHVEWLESLIRKTPAETWRETGDGFSHLLDDEEISKAARRVSVHHPLEYLGVLRGLCGGALMRYFDSTEDQIVLDRGMPVPFATRPVNALYTETTPFQPTLASSDLLQRGFRIFEHSKGEVVSVKLDFRPRDALDDLTWRTSAALPKVATLHPSMAGEAMHIAEIGEREFFEVRPASWEPDELLGQLRRVADVEIALLPELSLPTPDALQEALAADPDAYPALVVAGSAHVREQGAVREVRANEAHVYLRGRRLATHRKIHPYVARELPAREVQEPLVEGITREPKTITVLSGKHTRLAVVICSDLNDTRIPLLLEASGVNLLLVPALTLKVGAFNGALCELASRCQAVAVVANAHVDEPEGAADDERPFLVMAAVPRPHAAHQSREYTRPAAETFSLGVLDPNVPLSRAMSWFSDGR